MAAYVLVNIDIHDPEKYEEYKKLTPATLELYNGRFVIRGGDITVLEGERKHGRVVVLEFPTAEQAKKWWNSPEYAPAKKIRQEASITDMVLMEGFPG